jgi:cyanate permease
VVTGVISSGIPIGMALGLALTMPVIWPLTNSYQGVFFIWSIPVIVVTVLWWALIKEPHEISANPQGSKTQRASFRTVLSNKSLLLVSSLMFLHNFFVLTWNGWSPALMMMKGASPSLAGLIASTVLWSYIPAYLLMPRLSYKLGVRKPFLWIPSAVLALASWGATQVSVTASWFLMALVGIANGTRFVTLLALPVEIIDKKQVGAASGIVISIGYAGGVIGPLIGGTILDNTQSLNLSFMVLIGVSLIAAFLAFRLPETGPGRRT